MRWSPVRPRLWLLIFPLWLPLAILVVTAIRFASLSPGDEVGGIPGAVATIALMVLFAWIAAFPLTLAVISLHRRVRALAYVCGVVLAPLTVYGAVIGGLFGPVGIVLYPLVLSLPAWLVLGVTVLVQRRRSNVRPAESG
ncbi:MAG: hypothetical protein OXG33_00235 [Chloroflexi bacterium]|nr:hypothetical protein [Chloroflexota bacterium]